MDLELSPGFGSIFHHVLSYTLQDYKHWQADVFFGDEDGAALKAHIAAALQVFGMELSRCMEAQARLPSCHLPYM